MIVLPIFKMNDYTRSMADASLDYPLDACDITKRTFLKIDSVGEYEDIDGNKYANIHSGGFEMMCALTYKEVMTKIKENGLV